MTSRTKTKMSDRVLSLAPNNTSGQISAEDVRLISTDLVDTCFRDDVFFLESGDGRLLLESGEAYLGLELTPEFSPDSIADLASWLDAGVISTMTDGSDSQAVFADGDQFERWQEDLATSPVCAYWQGPTAPLSSSKGMEYVANRGGYPAVRVRGSTDTALSKNSSGVTQRCVTQDAVTLFGVLSSTVSGHTFKTMVYTAESFSGGTSGGYMLYLQRDATHNISQAFAPVFGGPAFTAPQLDTDDVRIHAVRGEGAGGTAEGYFNGVSLGTGAQAPSGDFYQTFGGSVLFQTSSSQNDYYIHEVLVYDRALNDTEVGQVHDYLTTKYGL
jgi:hypothetical protein